jgi:hypothetical protein
MESGINGAVYYKNGQKGKAEFFLWRIKITPRPISRKEDEYSRV